MTESYSPIKQARFRNRRRMAWVSMFALVGFGFGMGYRLFVVGDDPSNWTGIASVVLGSFAGIVLGYTGAAAYEHTRARHDQSDG